jgi:oxygen-independent coproporphyrinogen-3 oxidase
LAACSGRRAAHPVCADIEITLEANPGTFEQEKFVAYRQTGINRLSIGIQSFQPAKLEALGRIHNGDEAVRAAGMARAAGFDNFNMDLMHGLPDQSLDDALGDLRQAIELAPTHLSWYQLTVEPNTVFWNQPPSCPKTTSSGTSRKPARRCWPSTATAIRSVGLRPGRARRTAQPQLLALRRLHRHRRRCPRQAVVPDGRILRTWKTRLPKDYLNPAKPFKAGEKLPADELPFEFLMNALRLTEGVEAELFTQRTGCPWRNSRKPAAPPNKGPFAGRTGSTGGYATRPAVPQ